MCVKSVCFVIKLTEELLFPKELDPKAALDALKGILRPKSLAFRSYRTACSKVNVFFVF